MKLTKETALIETILFLEPEPIDANTLARISLLSTDIVLEAIARLQQRYEDTESGLEIAEIAGGFQIIPKKDLWVHLKDRYGKKNENILSKAALETLSIIAYSQPVTRSEIASIRGVSPDGMIKLLLSKDLIRQVGKKDTPGKPVQYGTTADFLKAFRLASIADLPRLDDLSEERFELEG
ncbi:MAG: SMC-Scp complex subunit ScpB [Spirochaetales bacterium]|nr:SMC-Scp complex subunit ScpB [Spirochaetales bacterium]